MKKILIISLCLLGMIAEKSYSQTVEVPFDSPQWVTENAKFSLQNYEGKPSLLLQSGMMYLKDLVMLDGTIEVDINFSGLRNFPGVSFRMVDGGNYENFYIRPHQSGNPDANQYTPFFNGLAGWQLYHGEKYATPVRYEFNTWHHLKIEVEGSRANIYFDDMETPLLEVKELLRTPQAGTVALSTRTNVHFANFKYTPSTTTAPISTPMIPSTKGLITTWQLAEIQDKNKFKDQDRLATGDLRNMQWEKHQVESTGLLNIARYLRISQEQNVAVLKLDIKSARTQLKELQLGYSDFVKIFVNGQAIYAGATNFRSRDYRYLGTIGYFDAVYLPLKKGKNEVVFVVAENFGGWGIQGVIEDRSAISID